MECIVLIGLPGAGKTTFFHGRFAATHCHVSKDLLPQRANRARRQRALLDLAFSAGHSVVVDNTNATPAERAAIIDVARCYHARVIGYFFDVGTRESVARNQRRTGRARVPKVAIFTVAKKLVAPFSDEGFEQLFRVRPLDGGDFEISPYY